jgi:tRNA modification GTPase
MQGSKDTIALVATPPGEGGIGVVQVSGLKALEIVDKLFKGKRQVELTRSPSGSLFYGTIQDKEGLIDEVLVGVWRKGESYTGEDLVEINCHGGIMPVRKVMEALLKAGVREGTWEELVDKVRPFAPGGILCEGEGLNLIQKEALLLLPHARTQLAVKMLLAQCQSTSTGLYHEASRLEGEVKRLKRDMFERHGSGIRGQGPGARGQGSEIRGQGTGDRGQGIGVRVKELFSLIPDPCPLTPSLEVLLDSSAFGLALVNPLKITIAGAPNVGKSTLFNALLREDRVLVHHEPGTTRDYVSEYISIEGIPLELIDTAGLREAEGVERVGVEWARALHQEADKVILVLDASRPVTQEEVEFIRLLDTSKVITVLNKMDIVGTDLQVCPYIQSPCEVSATEGRGLDSLKRRLISDFLPEIEKGPHRPIVFTHRQRGLLLKLLSIARELPEAIADCFTASGVLERLDDMERLFCCLLRGRQGH